MGMLENIPEDWNVIPAGKGLKYPVFKWDEFKERVYPRERLRGHNGNFAVICGKTSNNLFCIDLDFNKSITFDEKRELFNVIYDGFSTQFPEFADTRIHESPHGFHLYFYMKDDVQETKHYSNRFKGKVFTGMLLTRYHKILDGIDIQGDKALVIIPPSSVNGAYYKVYNNVAPKQITKKDFERILSYLLLPKPVRIRQGFIDIVNGKVDVHDLTARTGMDEHVYWKMLYAECYHILDMIPEQLFDILAENQPKFDYEETVRQLRHVDFEVLKPMTKETYAEYFPMYISGSGKVKKKKKKRSSLKEISIEALFGDEGPEVSKMTVKELTDLTANMIMEEFDIITLSDSRQMMVRKGNHYVFDLSDVYKRIKEITDGFSRGNYNTYRGNIISLISDATLVERKVFNDSGSLINFRNGVFDVMQQKLLKMDDVDKPVFFYSLPHDYKEGNYDCPKFKAALKEWLCRKHEKVIWWKGERRVLTLYEFPKVTYDDIFEMIGLCMSLNTSFKKAFLNYGPPHSGKTQFLNLLIHVIGDDNSSAVKLHRLTKNEFGTKRLQMKLLNACGEIPKRKIKYTDIFKELTGDDYMVPAEIKGGASFEFKNYAKFWFNANEIPPLDSYEDEAFFERFILIEFPNQFRHDEDEDFELQFWKTLTDDDEVQGIIHEGLKGLKRLIERKGFRPEITKYTKHIWLMESDPVYKFLNKYCRKKKGARIKADDFYEFYNEVGDEYLSVRAFTIALEKFKIYKRRLRSGGERVYFYINVEVKDEYLFKLEDDNGKIDLDGVFFGNEPDF